MAVLMVVIGHWSLAIDHFSFKDCTRVLVDLKMRFLIE